MPWLIETVRCGRGVSGRKGVLLPQLVYVVKQSKDISFLSINRACHLTIQRLEPGIIPNLKSFYLLTCQGTVVCLFYTRSVFKDNGGTPPAKLFCIPLSQGKGLILLAALEKKIPFSLANPYFAAEKLPGIRYEPRYFQLLHPAAGTWVEPYQSLVLTRDLGQKLM